MSTWTQWQRVNFCHRLNLSIQKTGIKQSRLALMAGCSQPAMHNYTKGNMMPGEATLIKIAIALNVSKEWLLGEGSIEEELVQQAQKGQQAQLGAPVRSDVPKAYLETEEDIAKINNWPYGQFNDSPEMKFALAELVIALCREQGVLAPQKYLEQATMLSQGTISSILNRHKWPRPRTILRVAKALKVTPEQLVDHCINSVKGKPDFSVAPVKADVKVPELSEEQELLCAAIDEGVNTAPFFAWRSLMCSIYGEAEIMRMINDPEIFPHIFVKDVPEEETEAQWKARLRWSKPDKAYDPTFLDQLDKRWLQKQA